MEIDDQQRTDLVLKFIRMDGDMSRLSAELSAYDWDFLGQPVFLDKSALSRALSSYVNGLLSADELCRWADFLELRDDVNFLRVKKKF